MAKHDKETAMAAYPHCLRNLQRLIVTALVAIIGFFPAAAIAGFSFTSIDGGRIDLDDWRGHPVLVVNTASLCGFTGQYDDLQMLQDTYGARGLKVLAVPSNDFAQELGDEKAVKLFCEVNFGLTIAMTEITVVTGANAHPFYAWVKDSSGFEPGWNFNKVLIGPDGAIVATWGSGPEPTSVAITDQIEALLQ
jgi:glutathione peroxidase